MLGNPKGQDSASAALAVDVPQTTRTSAMSALEPTIRRTLFESMMNHRPM
jgi:hypothetical protein